MDNDKALIIIPSVCIGGIFILLMLGPFSFIEALIYAVVLGGALTFLVLKILDSIAASKRANEISMMTPKEKRKLKAERNKIQKAYQAKTDEHFRGLEEARKKLICPHCQSKGTVTTSTKELTEETREKGIVGAVIGRKTITNKGKVTELHCGNCQMRWTA